jgi:hypothetical protein
MFGAWRTKSKEIWEAHLMVDHPAGAYSSNQYITRDDVHTDPVIVHYIGHNLLHPATWDFAWVRHRVRISHIYETHMD